MKVIPLTELRARLGRYARACQTEPVIVTIKGVPAFQLAPLDEDDDLCSRLIEQNPAFRKLLRARLGEPEMSIDEAIQRI